MNLLRSFLTITVTLCIVLSFSSANATERISNLHPDKMQTANIKYDTETKFYNNQLSSVIWQKLDSLGNAYSIFSDRQQPLDYFYYDDGKYNVSTLVFIMRGAIDIRDPKYAGFTGKDHLDNLFVRTSPDWGQTWSEKILLYDSDTETYGRARYPSIDAFFYDDSVGFVYTAPVTGGTGWEGFINGFYWYGAINSQEVNANTGGQDYGWGTDAKISGFLLEDGEPFGMAVGGLMPPGGNNWDNNSNLAYRSSSDFGSWPTIIPPAWASNKFHPVNQDSTRSSVVVDLERNDLSGTMYFAAFGNFVAEEPDTRGKVGVSVSNDNGTTWDDFIIAPHTIVRDYAAGYDINPDSVYIPYTSKGFVANDDGTWSFAVMLSEQNQDKTGLDLFRQIVELFYDGQSWGIRKVADITGYWLGYLDENGTASNNQMDIELQLARSVDGYNLVCKWVDFVGPTVDIENNVTFETNDIFMTAKELTSPTWGDPVNVTDDYDYDRTTWIPDVVPNGLQNIPIIKSTTIPLSQYTDEQNRVRQRMLEEAQWLHVGHANLLVGANDNPTQTAELQVTSLYPNPAVNETYLNYTIPGHGNLTVEIYDVMGRKVQTAYNNAIDAGLHSLTIKTSELAAGQYYATLIFNGQRVTKAISVVK